MSKTIRLPVRTASKKRSVWLGLGENQFRKHMVDLESASNEVPEDPVVHSLQKWEQGHAYPRHLLPLTVEQRTADDIAFVAAAEEGVKAVAAASIEELVDGQGIRVRLAMNEGVPTKTREVLETMFSTIATCASRRKSHSLLRHGTQQKPSRALACRSYQYPLL